MTRLLLTTLLATSLFASDTQVMSPPERRIYVNAVGDVLEWQPGLGIVVVKSRTTRVTKRRARADGKSIIELERETRVESTSGVSPTIPLDTRRAKERSADEGRSLMEEVEKPEVIPQ